MDATEKFCWANLTIVTALVVAGAIFHWVGEVWFVSVITIQSALFTCVLGVITANTRRKVDQQ